MKFNRFFFLPVIMAAAAAVSGCKDDVEPGTEPSDITGVFINEVCSGGTDWIEFFNAGDETVDLSGYHVQDAKGTEEEYTFPAGSEISGKGFLVIEEGSFAFGISGKGETITLLDEAYATIDAVTIPAMEDGFTYARTEDGGSSWTTVEGGTKGRSNTGTPDSPEEIPGSSADISAIRLNELNGNDKFIELFNTSDQDIDIAGLVVNKDDEDNFTASEGLVVPAHGFLTLWSEKSDIAASGDIDNSLIFGFGLSADKSVKIEIRTSDGIVIDVFKNLSEASGEVWGEDDGKYDSKDKGSFARETDGTGNWYIMTPSEGASNSGSTKVEDSRITW